MKMNGSSKRRGLFFPLLLVGLGVFLLLINLGVIPGTTRENLLLYWPVLLVLAGLDGLWRREGLVWPLVVLGVGVLLLLGNLGYLSVRALPLLAKIWPILLVAIGIDIAFGSKRSGWQLVLWAGLGLLVVGMIFWLAVAYPVTLGTRTVNFEQNLEEAQFSNLQLNVIRGRVKLSGGAESDQLLAGTAVLPQSSSLNPVYTKPVDGESSLSLSVESNNNPLAGDQSAYEYDFKVSSRMPIDLRAEVVIGELQLDLRNTLTKHLETELALGTQNLTIPCIEGLDVDVDQALGLVTLNIPRGCDVTIRLDNALVNTTLPAGWVRDGEVVSNPNVSPGAGEVEVRIGMAVGVVTINAID